MNISTCKRWLLLHYLFSSALFVVAYQSGISSPLSPFSSCGFTWCWGLPPSTLHQTFSRLHQLIVIYLSITRFFVYCACMFALASPHCSVLIALSSVGVCWRRLPCLPPCARGGRVGTTSHSSKNINWRSCQECGRWTTHSTSSCGNVVWCDRGGRAPNNNPLLMAQQFLMHLRKVSNLTAAPPRVNFDALMGAGVEQRSPFL